MKLPAIVRDDFTETQVENIVTYRQKTLGFSAYTEDYYTPQQLANMFDCSHVTVLNWIHQGFIKADKIYRFNSTIPRYRISPLELERLEKEFQSQLSRCWLRSYVANERKRRRKVA